MYLYETHCHSSDCSHCACSTARELVRAYHAAGFAGMVLTDHFLTGNTAVDRSLPWDAKMRLYYQAYLDACEEAAPLDFDVIFGIEHHYGKGKEVLVYGIDLDFLLANPDLTQIPLDTFVDRVHKAGGIVIHAHPYRKREYIDPAVAPRLDITDGIEVYNAGDGAKDEDRKALAQSRELGGIMTAGSDLHHVVSSKLGKAGVIFPHRVRNGAEFIAALREGACAYLVEGVVLPQIRETDLP